MKKIFLSAALACYSLFSSSLASAADPYMLDTDIDDLALIYIGSQHRPDWNKATFEPYVVHTYPDGSQSWMFDGFLMIEFQAYNADGNVVSFGESAAEVLGSKREDWERLLRVQLGTESGQGCRALDDLIGELIPKLGAPGHKHKVVFTLPVAETKSDIWGEIDGKKLIFTTNGVTDRITAMKWYADLLISEWNKAGFKNIELEGVYWTKETFSNLENQLLTEVNDYYHEKGLKIYWIPYLYRYADTEEGRKAAAADGKEVLDIRPTQAVDNWQNWKMDVPYVQPNYYFQSYNPKKYLTQAIDYVYDYEDKDGNHIDLGLELEFEGYNYTWSKEAGRNRITPSNCGLYGVSPTFNQRLVDYIDEFEDSRAFEYLPIAYYSGFQAVYDFENSGNPKDKEVMNRLASIINSRHVASGWDKEHTAAIDDITVDNRLMAYGLDNAIYIANEVAADVTVCSLDGRIVYSASADALVDKLHYGFTVACDPGVYVVRVADRSVKVTVK